MQIPRVHPTLPPYAIQPLAFPFRHLAALAGRAPIGGAREVALACFLSARLAADRLSPLPDGTNGQRGAGARAWLSTLSLPAPMRGPVQRCLEGAADGTRRDLAAAIAELSAAASGWLEPGSRAELEQLAGLLAT